MPKVDLELLSSELSKTHKLFKASEKAIEIVDSLKGLAQLEKELKTSTEKAKTEFKKIDDSLKKAESEIESKIANANAETVKIVATAKETADKLVSDAKAKNEAIIKADEKRLVDLSAKIEKAGLELGEIYAKLEVAKSELGKAETAKAKILKTLGA